MFKERLKEVLTVHQLHHFHTWFTLCPIITKNKNYPPLSKVYQWFKLGLWKVCIWFKIRCEIGFREMYNTFHTCFKPVQEVDWKLQDWDMVIGVLRVSNFSLVLSLVIGVLRVSNVSLVLSLFDMLPQCSHVKTRYKIGVRTVCNE